jgi:trimethylamine:corrinoid methyltransferase-like protein
MRLMSLFLLASCAANKAKMTGTVVDDRMYFDRMVRVKVTNAPSSYTWVKLNEKQLTHVKTGDKVTFYIKTGKVEYEAR